MVIMKMYSNGNKLMEQLKEGEEKKLTEKEGFMEKIK